jgi:hypothetical protein
VTTMTTFPAKREENEIALIHFIATSSSECVKCLF